TSCSRRSTLRADRRGARAHRRATRRAGPLGRGTAPSRSGARTSWTTSWSPQIDFGYGVTVNSLTVHSTTLMTAEITVAEQTPQNEAELIGPRDIVIDIGNCQVVLAQGFDVFKWDEVPTLTEWASSPCRLCCSASASSRSGGGGWATSSRRVTAGADHSSPPPSGHASQPVLHPCHALPPRPFFRGRQDG
ncbi:MAG: hypothetical protein M5U09_30515, partial [Gammaproteobacteria bacterium]|nr:hypothetical protein [Gammaproteobacteria bacterium]